MDYFIISGKAGKNDIFYKNHNMESPSLPVWTRSVWISMAIEEMQMKEDREFMEMILRLAA